MKDSDVQARLPSRRWTIGAVLATGVLVNYFDRISLSVAGPQLSREFGLSNAAFGALLSAFLWSYALLQIPAGRLLDRLGVTAIGRIGALLWALVSALTGLATGAAGVLAVRIALGIAEAPSFPANAKATALWFPRHERSLATAIFDSAAKFSNVIGVPLVGLVVALLGWRWAFAVVAALNLVYALLFWWQYRDPDVDPRLTPSQRAALLSLGADGAAAAPSSGQSMLWYLLGQRKVWGLALGFAAYGYCFYFFLTWLPGYFMKTEGFGVLKSVSYTAIPWAFATLADLAVGGWLVDRLIARGHDETRVRKGVLLAGMLMGTAVIGAAGAKTPQAALVWISIALSGLAAAAPVAWSLPALIAPRGAAGTVAGIVNFANNLAGALAPIVVGLLVDRTHSFSAAFTIAGVALLGGVASYLWLLGPLRRIEAPPR